MRRLSIAVTKQPKFAPAGNVMEEQRQKREGLLSL